MHTVHTAHTNHAVFELYGLMSKFHGFSSGAHKRFRMVRCRRYEFFLPNAHIPKSKIDKREKKRQKFLHFIRAVITTQIRINQSVGESKKSIHFKPLLCVSVVFGVLSGALRSMVIRGHKLICFMCCSQK